MSEEPNAAQPHDLVEELARRCLERLPEEGDAVVESICAEHPELVAAVRGVLRELGAAGLIEEQPAAAEPSQVGGFRLLRRLGGGGMGVVWLAEQTSLGRQVALKLMRPGFHRDAKTRERFRREVAAISKLDHPGVCTVFEAGEIDGQPYLAMRYVAGESLARVLAARSSGPARTKATTSTRDLAGDLALVEKLARALHAAHEAGVVHRDIKPGNVLIDGDGEPVIVDFGLAHAESSGDEPLTVSGEAVGTPAYMAPEQVAGKGDIDRRTDVYALGVTLYECLTGRPPFAAESREGLYRQITGDEPPDPRRFNRAIGRELAAVLGKALEKEPRRRFASALELAEELRRIRCHEPIRTRAPGPFVRAWRWCQRNPAAATVLATVSAALLVSLWLLAERTRARRELTALVWLSAAQSVRGEDAELSFKLAREAFRLDRGNPDIIAGVQAAMFELRDYRVVRDIGSEPATKWPHLEWVDFSPDGAWFVLTGQTHRPTVHRSTDGALLQNGTLDGVTSQQIAPIAWSSHEAGLLAHASDGQVQIYKVAAGRVEKAGAPLRCDARKPWSVALGAERQVVVRFQDGSWTAWRGDRTSVQPIEAASRESPWAAAFLPDGGIIADGAIWTPDGTKKLANLDHEGLVIRTRILVDQDRIVTVARDGRVRLWRLSGADVAPLADAPLRSSPDGLVDVDISPDGQLMALSYRDGQVHICRTTNGALVSAPPTAAQQRVTARFSRDGRRILGASWLGAVHVWQLDGTRVRDYAGHRQGAWSLAVDPRSEPGRDRFVTASWDGTARLWSDAPVPGVARLDGLQQPAVAAVTGSQDVVVTSRDGRVLLCDNTGRVRREHVLSTELGPTELGSVRMAPDRHTAVIAATDASIWTWDLRGNAEPQRMEIGSSRQWSADRFTKTLLALAMADDSYVVCRSVDGNGIFQWRPGAPDPAALALQGVLPRLCQAASTSPDGRMVLVGDRSGNLRLLGLDGRELAARARDASARRDALVSVVLFADGRRAAKGFFSGMVEIHDLAGQQRPHELVHHEGPVRALALSPDQRLLASASGDGTTAVWDTATGERLFVLGDRRGAVYDVVFVANDRLVTAGDAGRVLWWWLDPKRLEEAVGRIAVDKLDERERSRFRSLLDRTRPR